jgi:hypothetical protein
MTEWLSYDTTIDGASALVDVDASLDDPRERPAYRRAIELVVTGFSLDADRLPTEGADDELYALEQQIEDQLDERDGVLAATIATAGAYRFVAYGADAKLALELAAIARDAGLAVETEAHDDPGWQVYARWSLSGEALEEARDRAQIQELESVGDDLGIVHDITFDYEFEDEGAAEAGRAAFAEAGFDAEETLYDAFVRVNVPLVPTAESIRATRARLSAVADRCGGAYAGWGCEPVGGE